MNDLIIARIIHVVAVLFWIGGVAFVTSVVIPTIRKGLPSEQRLAAFHRIEGCFAWQARIWVALAGASGFWMVRFRTLVSQRNVRQGHIRKSVNGDAVSSREALAG